MAHPSSEDRGRVRSPNGAEFVGSTWPRDEARPPALSPSFNAPAELETQPYARSPLAPTIALLSSSGPLDGKAHRHPSAHRRLAGRSRRARRQPARHTTKMFLNVVPTDPPVVFPPKFCTAAHHSSARSRSLEGARPRHRAPAMRPSLPAKNNTSANTSITCVHRTLPS